MEDISTISEVSESREVHEELSNLNPFIAIDAKEFGEHVRNGGWKLGLFVARSVYTDYAEGEKPWKSEGISRSTWYRHQAKTTAENSALVSKISARAFAKEANKGFEGAKGVITDKTVTKYLKAWNMAASDGFVPHSNDLHPGQQFEFKSEFDLDEELDFSE